MSQYKVGDVIQFRWHSRSGVKRGRIVAITATQFQVDLFDGFGVSERVFVNRTEVL